MNIEMKAIFLVMLLLLPILPLQATAQQETPVIDIGQSTWNKLDIKVLVVLNESQSWWQPYFPNMTARAVQQWNDAFAFFVDNNPQYSYLSGLHLTTTLSNTSQPGYDVYIVFDPNVLISGTDALGETLKILQERHNRVREHHYKREIASRRPHTAGLP
jgi:hypothetical protein